MSIIYQAVIAMCLVGQPCEPVETQNRFTNMQSCMQYSIGFSYGFYLEATNAGFSIESIIISCIQKQEQEIKR